MLKYNLIESEELSSTLAVLVHGRVGNISVMSIFKNSIPKDWNILFVEAPYKDRESESLNGFSWWIKNSESEKDQINHSLNELNSTLKKVETEMTVKITNRIAIGFSQGGAILSLFIQKNPNFFSKLALLSSFALEYNDDNRPILDHLKILVSHGEEDKIITLEQNRKSLRILKDKGATIEEVLDETGHKLGKNGMKRLKDWLKD